jgi:hypothetical protein
MRPSTQKALYWTPRVLAIAFILFLALFALDVFGEGYSLGETLVALFMHLIPNFVLAAILVVAWKREWIGAVLFFGLGIFYLVATRGNEHWTAYLFISGPLFLMGILFQLNWVLRVKPR